MKWDTHTALDRSRLSDSWNRTDTFLPRMRLTTTNTFTFTHNPSVT